MASMIGVRELKNEASRIVREVREGKAEYVITLRGQPVALLRPFEEEDAQRIRLVRKEKALAQALRLAGEVGKAWTSPKSAVELIEEQRR